MKWFKYLVFGLLLAYIPMWSQINSLFGGFGEGKSPIVVIENSELTQRVKDKTGVEIKTIKILETDKLFGMMIGVPGNPQLILSRSLYDDFSQDEMEYVLLHEAGHYDLSHSIKELVAGIVLLIIGIKILGRVGGGRRGIVVGAVLGLLFGVVMIRLGAYNEIEADNYSVTRMNNPEGMITATEKFRIYYDHNFIRIDNPVIKWMFYRGNPYDNRIKMAKGEMVERD